MKKLAVLAFLAITTLSLLTGCDVQRPMTRDLMTTTAIVVLHN